MGKSNYGKLRSPNKPGGRRSRAPYPVRPVHNNDVIEEGSSQDENAGVVNLHAAEGDARERALVEYQEPSTSSHGSPNPARLPNKFAYGPRPNQLSPSPSPSGVFLDIRQYVLELRELQASLSLNDKQLEGFMKFNKGWHRTSEYGLPVSLYTLRRMEDKRTYALVLEYICPKCNEPIDRNVLQCVNNGCNFFGHRFAALNCGYGDCSIKDQLIRILEGNLRY